MKKILNIVSSLNGKDSFSNKLSAALLEKLKTVYPDSSVKTLDVNKTPFPHLQELHLASFYTPPATHTTEHIKAISQSNQAIEELMDADIIIIGVAMYNFAIPSALKAWIDHIVRPGVTFSYQNGVPEGLVKNKKLYLTIASGSVYSEGVLKNYDFTESYLKAVLGFLGITDVTVFRAEGTAVPTLKEVTLLKEIEKINASVVEQELSES